MSNDMFDILTQETFNMTQSMPGKNPFEQHTKNSPKEISTHIPSASGIFYLLKKSSNTFTIKIIPTTNLKEALITDNISIPPELKPELKFYVTEYYELALAISEQIGGYRFPINEEFLYNFSDRGENWWISFTKNSFKLHFKSHDLSHSNKNIKLGPIGDGQIANKRFRDFLPYAKDIFSPISFMSDNKSFGLQIAEENQLFSHFIQLFHSGNMETSLEDVFKKNLNVTLFYYFKELSVIRMFWLQIQKELGTLLQTNYSH